MASATWPDCLYWHKVDRAQPYPWRLKINPLWWLMNDEDPEAPSWYMPARSRLVRLIMWYLRNPLPNFFRYVVGVADRSHYVLSRTGTNLVVMSDVGRVGFNWSLCLGWWLVPLPFLSYTGKRVEWYLGWQPSGNLCAKFNLLRSHWQFW